MSLGAGPFGVGGRRRDSLLGSALEMGRLALEAIDFVAGRPQRNGGILLGLNPGVVPETLCLLLGSGP